MGTQNVVISGYLINMMCWIPTGWILWQSRNRDYGRLNWWVIKLLLFMTIVPYGPLLVINAMWFGELLLSKLGMEDNEDGGTVEVFQEGRQGVQGGEEGGEFVSYRW
jgi:hypothetical protein